MTNGNYELERHRMVENQLRERGIEEEDVLEAFERVPRHEFVNPKHRDLAYDDRALPTSASQTISQPYMVAVMTDSLQVQPGDRTLEIGTGSGYQTAILLELGAEVYTVETVRELSERARRTLSELGYDENVQFKVGDGSRGWAEEAPYERILVTAGAPELPSALMEQAADSARIVVPEGSRERQTLVIYEREDGGDWTRTKKTNCVFVPLKGDEGWDQQN